jgi:hypothetical protein
LVRKSNHEDLKDRGRAFDWLEKAIDERDAVSPHIHVEPAFDPLRSHPRYPALLRKMNWSPERQPARLSYIVGKSLSSWY